MPVAKVMCLINFKKLENENQHHAKALLDSFKFKRLEKSKTEKPFIPPQETIAERVKLERQKTGTGIKSLTPNKQIINQTSSIINTTKAGNNSYKL